MLTSAFSESIDFHRPFVNAVLRLCQGESPKLLFIIISDIQFRVASKFICIIDYCTTIWHCLRTGRGEGRRRALLIPRVCKIMQFALVWLSCFHVKEAISNFLKLLASFFMASKELHCQRINYHFSPFFYCHHHPTRKNFSAFLIIYCMYAEHRNALRLRASAHNLN